MLTQYPLYDNETIFYIEHTLYRLQKIKIAFENHRPINRKLFQPISNYPKSHAMTYFVLCIWDYYSAINYDTAYSEVAHKYLFKAFYNRTNKKEYESQILEHNICHINVITMRDTILIAKVPVGSAKKKKLVINTPDVKVTQVLVSLR